MKYRDLIQFEPINEVIKIERLQDDDDYRKSVVRTFVFSEAYEKTIIPELCRNLDYTASYETYGLQIVGNYGTGKSHLMSLFSLIAENKDYLQYVSNDNARKVLANIAGKYKVIRFEIASDEGLWRIICYQIDKALKAWGINYSIMDDDTPDMYRDKLERMMAHFEEKFPHHGLMIVVDEMLDYLKTRSGSANLSNDLQALRVLGQMCDHSKFRMVIGVQERIYNAPEFQWVADMLNKVNERYRQIEITRQDVQFVVQQRLLHKNEEQKNFIRHHLEKFVSFFTDMHANLEDYVSLFPVHPSFFENFQQVKLTNSKRQVMRDLSKKFTDIMNDDVPENKPGLICYDSYWDFLNTSSMQTNADIRTVNGIESIIHQKIEDNFTGGRASRAHIAHRIANACAVKILQAPLDKTNGTSAENLVDDLCIFEPDAIDREFLIDSVATIAGQIVTATDGSYFVYNSSNQEYHLRVEGGVNYEQKIKSFAETMTDANKDSHFFNYLYHALPIDSERYVPDAPIYPHHLQWSSHKVFLNGYLFMGNRNQRSTTQPELNYYIYLMPIFNKKDIVIGDEADGVYFRFDKVSQEMRDLIALYAAAEALASSADTSQKRYYEEYKRRYESQLQPIFQRDFTQCTQVYYQGELQTISPAMMHGERKMDVIDKIASTLLEDYFCQKLRNYPKFTLLKQPLSEQNRANTLRNARAKVANPTQPYREGEAILAGLGLLHDNQLNTESSIYAQIIRQKLEDKGPGMVLNRDEILYQFFDRNGWERVWLTREYDIEADLEFIVLAAMVALGEIEIELPGKNINAANLKEIIDLPQDNFYEFRSVHKPTGINTAVAKELFLGLTGKDYTSRLDDKAIYEDLVVKARELSAKALSTMHSLNGEIKLGDTVLVDNMEVLHMRNALQALWKLCDRVPNFASKSRLNHLPAEWTVDALRHQFEAKKYIEQVAKVRQTAEAFQSRISYLNQAREYMPNGEMKLQVQAALDLLPDVAKDIDNTQKSESLLSRMDSIIDNYAQWYYDEYKRMHLSSVDYGEKQSIEYSNSKRICDNVFSAGEGSNLFSAKTEYEKWNEDMAVITPRKSNVTIDAIRRSPYMDGFNPANYAERSLPSLQEMSDRLNAILQNINDALMAFFQDSNLTKNIDTLDETDQQLVRRFQAGDEELDPDNASQLVQILAKLHKGIRRVNITAEDLRMVINRPMTPDDAIRAFRKYIDQRTNGNNDGNVRIIFK